MRWDYEHMNYFMLQECKWSKCWQTKIRNAARQVYHNSNRPKKCFVCNSPNIDICHIKPIHKFSDFTLIKEINDIDNLIALCRPHHTKLDSGKLWLTNNWICDHYDMFDTHLESWGKYRFDKDTRAKRSLARFHYKQHNS